jgi:hypothetical protein
MALVTRNKDQEIDYSIKPEAVTPAIDTSTWPLLLKNYNNCMCEYILGIGMLLTSSSIGSHWTFHAYSQWLHTFEERPQVVH